MPRKQVVRLTIDFPAEQHTYIKMLAAKEGVSLRQFVIERLPSLDRGKSKGKKTQKNIDEEEFDELLKDLLVEKAPVLKRLAKK